MVYFKFEQGKKIFTALSVGLSIIAVLFWLWQESRMR